MIKMYKQKNQKNEFYIKKTKTAENTKQKDHFNIFDQIYTCTYIYTP